MNSGGMPWTVDLALQGIEFRRFLGGHLPACGLCSIDKFLLALQGRCAFLLCNRVKEISAICRDFGYDPGKYIDDGLSVEQVSGPLRVSAFCP